MREVTAPVWRAAVEHRFVDELWSGELDREVLTRYLAQDHQFVDAFLALLGAAVAGADRPGPRVRLARQLGLVAGPENDFFDRSLDALGSDGPVEPLGPTTAFVELMHDAAGAGYADALAVLVVAEWLYLDWASRTGTTLPDDPIHAEWIELHRGREFAEWVEFLRDELDRAADGLDRDRAGQVATRFVRAVDLELAFFDAAYG
ncbi:TenA family protein [Pseudonocardia endophytica]|uniref:Aminopyrimidine aminohydrolase n=1 Tax=Pseudonocardia endophytica TaxID=401976 RepID=A0A4V2PHB9_PSEEN|nr:TenA family protein [Pseudonocardia endophytica]TCK20166.1 thiaminase/transcriptional activator TenA [Pseudonocardia endophytica]